MVEESGKKEAEVQAGAEVPSAVDLAEAGPSGSSVRTVSGPTHDIGSNSD